MELMSSAISTHIYAIYIFLAIMIFNFYSVYKVNDFLKLAKRLRFMTPLYHSTNAVIIYTGMIVSAYAKELSLTIILMIIGIYMLNV